jgi:NAD(P)-dependent dehydrogenase (short-subunit alcohol dehydrogenase family)
MTDTAGSPDPGTAVSVVTGGAKGLGAAVADRLAARGDRVVVWDLVDHPVHDTVRCDVTDPGSIDRAVAALEGARIGVLVANAGAYPTVDFAELTPERWDAVHDLVLRGTYLVCHRCADLVIDGGHVVTIASTVTVEAPPRLVHYTAAKAGVVGFTRGLARVLGPRRITVNAVSPGVIATDTWVAQNGTDALAHLVSRQVFDHRAATVDDIAGAVVFLASDDARWITGQDLHVDGGMTFA